MTPERYLVTADARARFGTRIDRLAPFLSKSDPLADAVVESIAALPKGQGFALLERALTEGIERLESPPESFLALFAELDCPPLWVSASAIHDAGALLVRNGLLSGVVLGMQSLVLGYCTPGGNKPLVFSGRLKEHAGPRLNETAKFIHAVCAPGGMRRFGEGFRITVKVRLMHAQVRRMILQSGRWQPERWGLPINQHDMAGTILLFSLVVLRGLRQLGCSIPADEAERYLGLWRYVGHVIGVESELLSATEPEAQALADLIAATEGPPDEDSRELVRALMEVPLGLAKTNEERSRAERQVGLSYGLCRALIGDALADGLQLPRDGWRHAVPALRLVLSRAESVRRHVPLGLGDRLAHAAGKRYWDLVLERGMVMAYAEFGLPDRLAARVTGASA
jgi:hypothetical protein